MKSAASKFKKVCDKRNQSAQCVVIDDVKALKQGTHRGSKATSKTSTKHKTTEAARRDKMSHHNNTSSNTDLAVPKAEDQDGVIGTLGSETSEDGNIYHCIVCGKTGTIVCCDKCPRSFHPICLHLNENDLPDCWQCPYCPKDATEQDGDRFKEGKYYEELVLKYQSHNGCPGDSEDNDERMHHYCHSVLILDKILAIIDRLLQHDFGYIFAVPVSTIDLPDYHKIVKKPMDLGTIKFDIINSAYSSRLSDFQKVEMNELTEMDYIILEVLKDLELVWHNCLLYNREGKIIY